MRESWVGLMGEEGQKGTEGKKDGETWGTDSEGICG